MNAANILDRVDEMRHEWVLRALKLHDHKQRCIYCQHGVTCGERVVLEIAESDALDAIERARTEMGQALTEAAAR